jgi:DNA-binding CsgD family transcriptional regulator
MPRHGKMTPNPRRANVRGVPTISARDRDVAARNRAGTPRAELAAELGLSEQAIRRIIDNVRTAEEFERMRRSA